MTVFFFLITFILHSAEFNGETVTIIELGVVGGVNFIFSGFYSNEWGTRFW